MYSSQLSGFGVTMPVAAPVDPVLTSMGDSNFAAWPWHTNVTFELGIRAPDRSATAQRVTLAGPDAAPFLMRQVVAPCDGAAHDIFVKLPPDSPPWSPSFLMYNNSLVPPQPVADANVNFTLGTTSGSVGERQIVKGRDGWYRVKMKALPGGVRKGDVLNIYGAFVGNPVSTYPASAAVYLWGAQVYDPAAAPMRGGLSPTALKWGIGLIGAGLLARGLR